MRLSDKSLSVIAWGLAVIVCGTAFIAWAGDNSWKFASLSTYQIFPLLGLLAFSIMWTHYFMGTLRQLTDASEVTLKNYYRYTGYTVLILICLHPGLLVYQLFRDGAGLPPGSYERYVAPGLGWVAMLGFVSLLVFLAFELHRFFGDRGWWHFVADLSDAAMLAIIYHSLRLGTQLQTGWFRYLWWIYAITLVLILLRKYFFRITLTNK